MLYASPNRPCVSSLGSHTNPASWQGPGLKCPFHRSKNKEPLDTSRLETNSQMQQGGFTLETEWCFKPHQAEANQEAGVHQPFLYPPGPEMALPQQSKSTPHFRGYLLENSPQERPCRQETPPRRAEGERLWRTESFRGDVEWWQQKLPVGKNSWGAICLEEASGPFHYPPFCICRRSGR